MTLDKNNQENINVEDPSCHNCSIMNSCVIGKVSETLDNCPMKISPDIQKKARELYEKDKNIRKTTQVASIIEATGYIQWPRLKDTVEFAKGMDYKKLGIAFCGGLIEEAKTIAEILEKYGFNIVSVCCKTGGVKKTVIGVPEEFTRTSKTGFYIGHTTCNPVAQALLMNKSKTDMNIIIGLCVGHDMTFTKLSDAPVTTLIAKDRRFQHNPAGVIYNNYGKTFIYKDLMNMSKSEE